MKKFTWLLAVVVLTIFAFSQKAEAFDTKRFTELNKEIIREYIPYEKDPAFRDFDFLLKMTLTHIKAMDMAVRNARNEHERYEMAVAFTGTLKCDYASLELYLQEYVVKKSSYPDAMERKCKRFYPLLRAASNLLTSN